MKVFITELIHHEWKQRRLNKLLIYLFLQYFSLTFLYVNYKTKCAKYCCQVQNATCHVQNVLARV